MYYRIDIDDERRPYFYRKKENAIKAVDKQIEYKCLHYDCNNLKEFCQIFCSVERCLECKKKIQEADYFRCLNLELTFYSTNYVFEDE